MKNYQSPKLSLYRYKGDETTTVPVLQYTVEKRYGYKIVHIGPYYGFS